MIINNNFKVEDIKNIVIIGFHEKVDELIKINDKLKINTEVITSSDQSKNFPKHIKFKIFDKIDKEFKFYLAKKKLDSNNTLFFSISARNIFTKETIKYFNNNLINLHGSRLPYDAGGAVYSWQILKEDRIAALTIHMIDESIDSGPIIMQKTMLYPSHCRTPIELQTFCNEKFVILYEEFLRKLRNKEKLPLSHQSKYIGRYNPRLSSDQSGWIDWGLESYDLISFINAFDKPYDGASTFINNKKYKRLFIKKAQLHGGETPNHPYMQGIIVRHDKDWIIVSTKGKHTIIIEEVLDKNKKNVISELKVGDRFYTPQNKIEKDRSERVFYNSKGRK